MVTPITIARIEKLIWILIYGGLFLVVLGIASASAHAVAAWTMGAVGGVAAVAGCVLIFVRARMKES